MDLLYSVKILEHCSVSPPSNSVPTTSIPLTFFDMPWITIPPVERILFYEFPHPTLHFTQAILPELNHSLSLTLQHFFPLAGSLVCPPLPTAPHILYQNGDSIPLTIAESNSDFAHLVKNCPRDAREFRTLVPKLPQGTNLSPSSTDQVSIQLIRPLIAFQVTIFPNSGISICFTYRHMVGDGRTMNHFIKSWASIFKSKNDLSQLVQPDHDRAALVKDPNGLLPIFCNQWCERGTSWDNIATANSTSNATLQDKLHATFVLDHSEINKLKHWVAAQFKNINEPPPLLHVSTFVVTCAFIWVCLTRTENDNIIVKPNCDDIVVSSEENVFYHIVFPADCTNRNDELQMPKTYFGNCVAFCGTTVRKSELLGENGLFMAAKALMEEVKELERGLLKKAKRWLPNTLEMLASGHLTSVAGSPRLRVYETDFGWGRPTKSEVVHIDKSPRTISLTETRDEEGGVEVGLALNKISMDAFISIFEQGLKNVSC